MSHMYARVKAALEFVCLFGCLTAHQHKRSSGSTLGVDAVKRLTQDVTLAAKCKAQYDDSFTTLITLMIVNLLQNKLRLKLHDMI
jgi:hypothetical protein